MSAARSTRSPRPTLTSDADGFMRAKRAAFMSPRVSGVDGM